MTGRKAGRTLQTRSNPGPSFHRAAFRRRLPLCAACWLKVVADEPQHKIARYAVVKDIVPLSGAQVHKAVEGTMMREKLKVGCHGEELIERAFVEKKHSRADLARIP